MMSKVTILFRNVMRSQTIRHRHGGVPGENLPFNINGNKYVFTLKFALFFSIPFAAPFVMVTYQLRKNMWRRFDITQFTWNYICFVLWPNPIFTQDF